VCLEQTAVKIQKTRKCGIKVQVTSFGRKEKGRSAVRTTEILNYHFKETKIEKQGLTSTWERIRRGAIRTRKIVWRHLWRKPQSTARSAYPPRPTLFLLGTVLGGVLYYGRRGGRGVDGEMNPIIWFNEKKGEVTWNNCLAIAHRPLLSIVGCWAD